MLTRRPLAPPFLPATCWIESVPGASPSKWSFTPAVETSAAENPPVPMPGVDVCPAYCSGLHAGRPGSLFHVTLSLHALFHEPSARTKRVAPRRQAGLPAASVYVLALPVFSSLNVTSQPSRWFCTSGTPLLTTRIVPSGGDG